VLKFKLGLILVLICLAAEKTLSGSALEGAVVLSVLDKWQGYSSYSLIFKKSHFLFNRSFLTLNFLSGTVEGLSLISDSI
jgi:hypothetical protein